MSLYDKDIRKIIKSENPERRMVDEINVYDGTCRIDLLDITDTLIGWEIKSDNDSLGRLSKQIKTYSKCLPYINVACGSRYIERLEISLPAYVGLYEVYKCPVGRPVLDCKREAQKNPEIKSMNTLALLWKAEMIDLLTGYGSKNIYRLSKWKLIKELKKYIWDRRCSDCGC